jgi:hypothetical protein
MGFRFYRRFRILPGVSVNVSKSGTSISVGKRGAHITVGRKGVRETVGIPGTGISYTATQKSSAAAPARGGRSYRGLLIVLAIAALLLLIHLLGPGH